MMVASGGKVNVNDQSALSNGLKGGYDPERGGLAPWKTTNDLRYIVSEPKQAEYRHAYTDSASSATSMVAGVKTYNGAINVDPQGGQVATIAHPANYSRGDR